MATKENSKKRSASDAPRADRARPARNGTRVPASRVAGNAARELLELTGREIEGIVGLERSDHDGWTVHVEVLEVRRIPDTTDVLALYEIDADEEGYLTGYRRLRRYVRGAPSGEDDPR